MAKPVATQEVEVEPQEQPEAAAEVVEVEEPVTVVSPLTKRARVKGTWTQYFGQTKWEFEDQKAYDLPTDLYEYLKARGCIYDVLI